MKRAYQTDLSDAEWGCLEPYLPVPNATGRPKMHTTREIIDAIFYVLKSGCAWRLLPHDFPTAGRPSTTTSGDSAWMAPGRGCTQPCAKRVRVRMNRDPEPSAGVVDSQPVKTTGVGGDQRGYDA